MVPLLASAIMALATSRPAQKLSQLPFHALSNCTAHSAVDQPTHKVQLASIAHQRASTAQQNSTEQSAAEQVVTHQSAGEHSTAGSSSVRAGQGRAAE